MYRVNPRPFAQTTQTDGNMPHCWGHCVTPLAYRTSPCDWAFGRSSSCRPPRGRLFGDVIPLGRRPQPPRRLSGRGREADDSPLVAQTGNINQ